MATPPPELTISQWADRHRKLNSEASAEPGQWSTSRAEYQRGIMDAVSDPAIETVVVMSSSQTGKTEVNLNTVGYHIHQDPAPIMVVMPTERDAETWSKDRFSTMARDTACLRGRVSDPRSRDGSNKILHKKFPGGHLTMVGANAPSGLASRPIRILLCDEVDRYPPSAGAEGDPVNLARKRTVTFWNRKVVLVSTPTIKGYSRIEAAYAESDRRRYWVPCPDCGAAQVLIWPQVRWDRDGSGAHRPETARYACAHCGSRWSDARRWAAVRDGEWRAEAPTRDIAGFHLNEIYSSWVRLEDMVKAFLSAREGGEETMKTFINTALGEVFEVRGEAPDWQRLYDRREDYRIGTVPRRALFLTAGADVQKDRIEVSVWAWGRDKESWLIEHRVIEGDTSRAAVWGGLTRLLSEVWTHESGAELALRRLAIDSGYATQEVYAWARAQGLGRVMAVKGVNRSGAFVGLPTAVDVTAGGKRLRRGVRVHPVAGGIAKLELFNNLRKDQPTEESGEPYPPGYVHLPKVDGEYCKQMCSEQLVTTRNRRGYAVRDWQKLRERNEALDCYVYARAAAAIYGLDRFQERHWSQLEQTLGGYPAPTTTDRPTEPAARPARPASERRGGWLGERKGNWLK